MTTPRPYPPPYPKPRAGDKEILIGPSPLIELVELQQDLEAMRTIILRHLDRYRIDGETIPLHSSMK